ncbi:MAG: hypothetical protein QOF65_2680 [Thermoleophilaceae bacterium]|nr:hypothetical protein [Thermoleophilaceae bacterium]
MVAPVAAVRPEPLVTPFEVAAGQAFGEEEVPPFPQPRGRPVEALEVVLSRALERPPCVVAFSGGRDSSALLALATRVARREGHEPPIAVTQYFPGAPDSDEREWQELVIRHLELRDWERLERGVELDLVGPIAAPALRSHGALYPSNAHFLLPIMELARGGSVVTGVDGDIVFGGWDLVTLGDVRGRRRPPRARDVAFAAVHLSPAPLRKAVMRRRRPSRRMPWLTESAQRELDERRLRHVMIQPPRFDAFVRWAATRRMSVLMERQFDRIAAGSGTELVHPLLDPGFRAAYAAAGGRDGFGDRTSTMEALFGDLLPERLVARPTKAGFDAVYLSEHTRALVRSWDGTGFDPAVVDAEALHREWQLPVPSFRTGMLIQQLWVDRAFAGSSA